MTPSAWADLAVGGDVTMGSERVSRDELLDRALRLAERLVARTDRGPVAVHAVPSLATVTAVLAGTAAGVPVVPVPPDSGSAELRHVLSDSGATTWLGPDDRSLGLPGAPDARAELDPTSTTGAAALILYTSGTTGPPKGVPISGRALDVGLAALAEAWAWTPDDVLVHGLPLFHLHGLVLGVLGPLRVGSALVHTGRPTPSAYAAAVGSMYFGVPTVWHRIAAEPEHAAALRRARLLVSGSAPLPATTFNALRGLTGRAPLERYGMTETGITLAVRADAEPRAGWVGVPVGATETRVRDETGAAVPADGASMGRLEVRGPTVLDGYLGRPEATKASFTDDGWFRTGDLAVVDGDGWHRIVGRESVDLIKTGGYRVGAGEVEAVLLDHPAVHEAAVVGRPDDDLGQRIVAYVVADPAPGLEERLVEHVAIHLSAHKRPRAVVLVDELPRNPMGKVLKTDLP